MPRVQLHDARGHVTAELAIATRDELSPARACAPGPGGELAYRRITPALSGVQVRTHHVGDVVEYADWQVVLLTEPGFKVTREMVPAIERLSPEGSPARCRSRRHGRECARCMGGRGCARLAFRQDR